jgi:hypothetical protein
MFSGCKNLAKILLPTDEKATSIQNCYEMFSGCSKLTSIDLSKFSFVNLDDLSYFFNECYSLETIILPQDEIANNINTFDAMFYGCEKLTSINLDNIDFKNAESLYLMFTYCRKLENINLPTSAKADNIEYYDCMFCVCESLISVDLSNFSFTKVTSLDGIFAFCNNLQNVILPKNEIATNVEYISYLFDGCFKLQSIDLSGISFINMKDINHIFNNCKNLETIIFRNDEEIENIEHLEYAFANCHKLISLDLSNFYFEKVENFSYLFFSCNNLKSLKLSPKTINKVKFFNNTFANCTQLESIDLTAINMSSIIH